jgi:hypothetical protein
MHYIIVDFVVEVPDGVDADDLTRRLTDRFVDAVEAEGAVMGGGLRPATEAEVVARYDALGGGVGVAAGLQAGWGVETRRWL